MENYISCCCSTLPNFTYIDAITYQDSHIVNNILDMNCLSYDDLDISWDITLLIKNCIDNNKYVVIFTDEFFCAGRPAFNSFNMLHEILIYGYDLEYFYYIAFDENMNFCSSTTPITTINSAYRAGKELAIKKGLIKEYNHSIIIMRFNEDIEYNCFSMNRFSTKIMRYLSGRLSCEEHLINNKHDETISDMAVFSFHGIDNTLMFEKYLNICDTRNYQLFTAVHSWYEHKKGLLSRFRYIASNDLNPDTNMIELVYLYDDLIELAELIRMNAYKLLIQNKKKNEVIFVNNCLNFRKREENILKMLS